MSKRTAGAGGIPAINSPPGIPLHGDVAPGRTTLEAYEGYLLGDKSLSQEERYLEKLWKQGAAYDAQSGGWTSQSGAKSVPASS